MSQTNLNAELRTLLDCENAELVVSLDQNGNVLNISKLCYLPMMSTLESMAGSFAGFAVESLLTAVDSIGTIAIRPASHAASCVLGVTGRLRLG